MSGDGLNYARPKVSVGMPVYNGERFIADALQSLLSQYFDDFEIIVADNDSCDSTAKIVADFQAKDSRISYYCQSHNLGAIENFNDVKAKARGEYFMWAAADDLWDPDWIGRLLENFQDDCVISFGHVVNIDAMGEVIRQYRPFRFGDSESMRLAGYFLTEEFNGKANMIYGLYRTSFLRNHPLKQYYQCPFGFDMHFVFDCLQSGKISCDDSVLIYKRDAGYAPQMPSIRWHIANSLLMYNRLRYFITYPRIASSAFDKFILSLLVLVKYLKSLLFNLHRFIRSDK